MENVRREFNKGCEDGVLMMCVASLWMTSCRIRQELPNHPNEVNFGCGDRTNLNASISIVPSIVCTVIPTECFFHFGPGFPAFTIERSNLDGYDARGVCSCYTLPSLRPRTFLPSRRDVTLLHAASATCTWWRHCFMVYLYIVGLRDPLITHDPVCHHPPRTVHVTVPRLSSYHRTPEPSSPSSLYVCPPNNPLRVIHPSPSQAPDHVHWRLRACHREA